MSVSLQNVRNSFGSAIFNFSLASRSLVEVQKTSYFDFLYSNDHGTASVDEIFKSLFPVSDSFGYATVEFVSYRVAQPKMTVDECKKKSATYGADIFVTLRLILFDIDQTTGTTSVRMIKEQEVSLCNIPLMTDNVTFVINGFERVVISQIHRSPGVFFARELIDNTTIYSANIIPYRGSWLELSFDQKNNLNFKIDKKKKFPIYHLLSAMGMDVTSILECFYNKLLMKYDRHIDMWLCSFDFDGMVGQYAPFDIFDSNGSLLLQSGKVVTNKISRTLASTEKCYCKSSSLRDNVIAESIDLDGNVIWELGTQITDDMIDILINNNVSDLYIIDNTLKSYSRTILSSLLSNKHLEYEAIMEAIFKILRPGEPFTISEAEKHFHNLFFSDTYYNLFAVGRYKINVTLGLSESQSTTVLTHTDIIETIKKLINLMNSSSVADDIDSLSNRRVRSVGELLENQFRIGLSRVARTITEKLNTSTLDTVLPEDLIIAAPLAKAIKDFFMTSQLSQFVDQTNPLSELAHKRRISSLGAGGLNRERAGVEVRDVHPTHYGRICPIETPEGQNIGLISSLATYSIINKYGFIETPYRVILDGKLSDEIVFFDAIQESKYVIAQAESSAIKDNKLVAEFISARKNGDSVLMPTGKIEMIDVSPKQIVSVVASLIPFLENDDAKRALMGSNMQRQAVPLIVTEAPLVGTGMEKEITKDSGVLITAKRAGIVTLVDAQRIIVKPTHSDANNISEIDIYNLLKFRRSNQSTCINQIPLIRVGDIVDTGDIIADGPATANGEIALGKNILVAFMPWNGYNFEDSIVISEKIVHDDVFTSIHIEEFEIVVRDTRLGSEEVTRDIPNIQDDALHYLDETGIVHIGAHVGTSDILVGKVTPKSETPITPEEKLLRAIFGEKIAEVTDSSLRVPPGMGGTVVDVQILTKRGNEKDPRAKHIEQGMVYQAKSLHDYHLSIIDAFFSLQLDNILQDQDVTYINKSKKSISEKMTRQKLLNFKIDDKIKFDCKQADVASSLATCSHQYNIAVQASKNSYISSVEKIMDGDDLPPGVLKIIKVFIATKSRLQPGDKMAGRHGNKGIVAKVVPVSDMPFMADGTPVDMVLNPLGVPGRINIGQIMETHLGFASHMLGKKVDQYIKDGESVNSVRDFLNHILTDNALKKYLHHLSDEDLINVAKIYSNGIPYATPVFEGARVSDIEQLLEKAGVDKSGQITLYDGQTGSPFDRKVTVGYMYMMKLHHLVANKIHARSTGPYSLVTQQPLGGKSHFGGQRFGEMECWALQAYGASYVLQEMLTVKSDDVDGRTRMYESIVKGEMKFTCGIPESFNVLFKELRALCFNIKLENSAH